MLFVFGGRVVSAYLCAYVVVLYNGVLAALGETHESEETMKSSPDSVQKAVREVHDGCVGVFVLRKRKCLKASGGYLRRDGVCLYLGQMWKGAERAESAV